MTKAMMNWADKMMMLAHKAVRSYQAACQQEKDMPPAVTVQSPREFI